MVVDVCRHGIILIRSDKDKEESDKKAIGVCREYKDSIQYYTFFSEISEVGDNRGGCRCMQNLLMEVMSTSDKMTDLDLTVT